ncbi:MAG TPA: prolyl oligopeptidase family serine peptidase [Allosphingosinicella sp.]|uniref:S9 family peptidase n=1 Tax=Allosphingosinicella sp. TaxID=2823234 RepID=UPI002ED9FF66
MASGLVGARNAQRFAWVENRAGVRNIWVAEPGRAARRITQFTADDGVPVADLALSADGRRIAFVRGGDPEFADEDLPNAASAPEAPRQQLFVANVDGGPATAIGDGHSPVFSPAGDRLAFTRQGEIWLAEGTAQPRRVARVNGEVNRLQWSPDGRRLLFVDYRDNHSFVGLLDLAEGRLSYLDPGLGYSAEPIFSPDGRQVAFVRYFDPPAGAAERSGPYWSIHVADAATGAARRLWSAPAGLGARYMGTRSRNLFWSAAGEIVFPWERSGWLHPYAIDALRGGTPRELTPGAFEVETYLLTPDGRSLVYAANADDLNRRHIWRRPLNGGVPERLTSGDGIASYPTFAGETLAMIATDVTHPAYPALVGRMASPLGNVATASGFTAPEAVRFRAEDGIEVHGQLFRGRGAGKRPGIVYVHGGPRRQMLLGFHPSSYYSNAYIMNQHLAAQGYNVLAVNYRSGTGYGQAFRDAKGIAREGASEYRDILAAGRWLAARADGDPSRIGIWGGSWGGYLGALALARDSDLFKVGVDFHGVHTLLRPVPDTLSPDAQLAARQLQWQSSPMASIDRWRSPVLLIHGDDDRNVPYSQSVLLARELAARGIRFEELVFPNERHGFLRHAHWLQSLRATERFLNAELKPQR